MDNDTEALRNELNKEIVLHNWDLTHPAIIMISHLLDELIVEDMKKNLNNEV